MTVSYMENSYANNDFDNNEPVYDHNNKPTIVFVYRRSQKCSHANALYINNCRYVGPIAQTKNGVVVRTYGIGLANEMSVFDNDIDNAHRENAPQIR